MGQVLLCQQDVSFADATVTWPIPASNPRVYVTFEAYFSVAAWAALSAETGAVTALGAILGAGGFENDLYLTTDSISFGEPAQAVYDDSHAGDNPNNAVSGLTPGAWHTLSWCMVQNGDTSHLRVDATDDTHAFGGSGPSTVTAVKLGGYFQLDQPVYLRTIKAGTTPGGSDLLDYDPDRDGDPAAFGFTVVATAPGSVTLVADPGTPAPPWVPPEEAATGDARLPFAEAQAALSAGGALRSSASAAVLGWHGTSLSPERGSFALVRAGGPLEGLVGRRIRLTNRALLGREVWAYVEAAVDLIEDVSVTRHLFALLELLAAGEVAVVLEEAAP